MLARFDENGNFTTIFKKQILEVSEDAKSAFSKIDNMKVADMPKNWIKWAESMGYADDNLKEFLTTSKEAYKTKDLATYTQYLNDHNKTLDLATLKTKAWAFAKNMAVNAAIGLAMYGVNLLIKQFDKWIVTTEESREALANLKSECQTIESDLKATNDELEVTRQRMDELEGKGTLTFTEKEEYDNLVKQNNELQRTIDLLKLEQKEKNKEKNKTFVETMEKDVEQHGEYHVSDYGGKVKKGHGGRDIGMNTDEKAYINQQFKDYQDNLAKMAELDAQYKDDLGNKQYQKDRKRLEDQNKKISEYLRGKNTEFTTDADGIEYIENPSNDDEEKVNKWLDFINDFQDKMAIAMGGDNAETNAFNRVVDNWQFDEVVQGLQDLGKEGKVTADMLNDPKYDEFIQKLVYLGIIDSADNLDEIALAFNNVGTEAENSDEKVNKMTVSLSELEGASDKIKTLGSAFKELSDDGYITTKTLGEIQTATGLSGDEWAEYESKLLNAKKGSAEFSQIMADLTYKMLDQTFANKDLNSLTEQQISAILRENGVVNADAVAHDWLTKAKETLRIKTALAKASTAEAIVALATEASQAGITGNALNDLIMDMGIFNNTNLDVSQKVAALQEMGYYAHWTAQGLANIDKVKKYSFDGKDYIVSYDNGKLVGIEQEREIDIPKVEVPKITVPNYSGAASGGKSGSDDKPKYSDPKYSDPTDAIIKRINAEANQLAKQGEIIESNLDLIDSEKDYAKAIDETNNLISNRTSQINALKLANSKLHNEAEKARNSNSYTNEESWFDADGDETEAFHELMNSLKTDDAQEKLQNEFNKIQKFKKAYLENEKLIQDLTKENIKSIEDISDIASEALENHFDERNEISERWIQTQTDFDQLAIDGQIEAYARMVRNNREFLKEIEKNEHLSAEERDRLWKETSDKIVDYQLEAYNLVKKAIQQYGEEVEKGYDIRISRLNSESSLLSTHFDLINAISEEQHNLNKELAEAEVAGAKMNKIERQTLFTKEEHAKLTDKLNGLLGDAVAIQSDYLSELETATKETIEEITNNYERQYELKMKEYEVVKAELALVKAEQKLKNVENEKSVRTWDGTKWIYEADFQDVVDAKLAVEDAKYAVWQAQTSQAQQTALNAIDSTADSLETQKNLFAETLEELSGETKITGQQLTEALKYIAEVDLPTFEKIIEQFGDSLSEAFDVDVDSVRGSAGGSSSSGMPLNSSHLNYSRTVAKMQANSAAYASASDSKKASLHEANANLAAGIGATFNGTTGHWEIKGTKLYANGSKSTPKGLGIFDEHGIGSEYVLTKDGILHNFNMGDKVFNPKMGDNLYEAAQIDWKKVSLADFGGLASIDNSIRNMSSDTYYNVNGVNINSEEGGEIKGFVKFLKAKKI